MDIQISFDPKDTNIHYIVIDKRYEMTDLLKGDKTESTKLEPILEIPKRVSKKKLSFDEQVHKNTRLALYFMTIITFFLLGMLLFVLVHIH